MIPALLNRMAPMKTWIQWQVGYGNLFIRRDHSITRLCGSTAQVDPEEWTRAFKQVGLRSDGWGLAAAGGGSWALIDVHTALLHPISQAFRHWVGLGFRDSVKFCLQAFEKFVFGIEARRAAGTRCREFDPVRIGRGGDHISEGIQLGGEVTSL